MDRIAEESPRRRVGVFGGTFDPPHVGHVSVASDAADALELEEVLWIPVGNPPHKAPAELAPPEVRLEMTRAAAAADPRFRVSEIELRRGGPSYTVHTLHELGTCRETANAELVLIMGHDQYRDFGTWREPERIRELATLAVMDRDGDAVGEECEDGVVRVRVRRVDVSSSDIRDRVARGEDVSRLVPSAVYRIIVDERLYRR